ncbi:hypothetical protein [Streptomyces sp. NBC_01235]|uniref:hypothetical protein n=1 Tax=Streptomyces sp. NBC_01235 TaxID=2903788 RepID=UPI002E0D7A74|nr:hypothetical protein OG289_22270 [Streptomyces sp. NBC_01235]
MTISYQWDLRTQIDTTRRHGVFASAEETQDVIRRHGHFFPDRLDEVSKKMHKRRSKQLAKAKAKLEKAEKKARKTAEAVAVAVLEDPAA